MILWIIIHNYEAFLSYPILTYAIFTAKSINWANLWFLSAWQLLFLWCLRNSNILFLPITILLIVCSFYYPYLGLNTAFLLASLKVCRPSFADSIYLRQSISFYALHSCLGSINLFRRLGSFSARMIRRLWTRTKNKRKSSFQRN